MTILWLRRMSSIREGELCFAIFGLQSARIPEKFVGKVCSVAGRTRLNGFWSETKRISHGNSVKSHYLSNLRPALEKFTTSINDGEEVGRAVNVRVLAA